MAEANNQDEDLEKIEINEEEMLDIQPIIIEDEQELLKQELQECKDKYLRVLAESENARKRLIKERQEMVQFSMQNLICEFLGPIDQMEKALKYADKMSDEVKMWSTGFQMILTHFLDVLASNNVYKVEALGRAFDPHLHDAVEMIPTADHPAGIVLEECSHGYKMGERLIRPARVKVSKALDNNNNNEM